MTQYPYPTTILAVHLSRTDWLQGPGLLSLNIIEGFHQLFVSPRPDRHFQVVQLPSIALVLRRKDFSFGLRHPLLKVLGLVEVMKHCDREG